VFLEINRRYQARLKKYLKRYLDDRIDDVVQETFFRLFRLLEGDAEVCLEKESLHPLIFFIAAKVAVDDVRSESRRRRLHNAFALFPLDGPRPADADVIAAEIRREVRRALTNCRISTVAWRCSTLSAGTASAKWRAGPVRP